jgi:hypothetical protein
MSNYQPIYTNSYTLVIGISGLTTCDMQGVAYGNYIWPVRDT